MQSRHEIDVFVCCVHIHCDLQSIWIKHKDAAAELNEFIRVGIAPCLLHVHYISVGGVPGIWINPQWKIFWRARVQGIWFIRTVSMSSKFYAFNKWIINCVPFILVQKLQDFDQQIAGTLSYKGKWDIVMHCVIYISQTIFFSLSEICNGSLLWGNHVRRQPVLSSCSWDCWRSKPESPWMRFSRSFLLWRPTCTRIDQETSSRNLND